MELSGTKADPEVALKQAYSGRIELVSLLKRAQNFGWRGLQPLARRLVEEASSTTPLATKAYSKNGKVTTDVNAIKRLKNVAAVSRTAPARDDAIPKTGFDVLASFKRFPTRTIVCVVLTTLSALVTAASLPGNHSAPA